MDNRVLDMIIKRIEEEKCILFIGPEVFNQNEKSLNEQLKIYLEETSGGEFKFYTDDEFFSFADEADKEYAYYDIQQFYEKLPVLPLYQKIAALPFHLIVSVSPDVVLKKIFEEQNLDFTFDFYNKEKNPQPLGKPTAQKPLIYNLFGSIENEGSLILTHNDLFDYLIAIFGKHNLHQDLRDELQAARMILFLGFKFEKWYFKLLLRLLNFHKGKLSHAALKDAKLLPQVRNFYSEEFKIKFLDNSGTEIIEALYERCAEKNALKTKTETKPLKTNEQAEIYLSYGWGGESEQIVNSIYEILKNEAFNVIRDKVDLGYKGNIKEFMQTIGKGKYVVVVISDKYLKSENCMFEMLEIKNNGSAYDRIFPIVLSDARIYDEIDRIDYLNFWDDKVTELKKKVETLRDPVGKVRVYEKMNQYADINRIIDEITDTLRNMNTLTPEMHKDANFEQLIKAIHAKMQSDK